MSTYYDVDYSKYQEYSSKAPKPVSSWSLHSTKENLLTSIYIIRQIVTITVEKKRIRKGVPVSQVGGGVLLFHMHRFRKIGLIH